MRKSDGSSFVRFVCVVRMGVRPMRYPPRVLGVDCPRKLWMSSFSGVSF